MSDLLQSRNNPDGQHPDADQLNAFVEQTLPEHERADTLAHLAECANCREIVALSLPPLEDAAAVVADTVPVPWFAGWFAGWKLVWIAAPALAGLALLTVHLRNLPTSQNRAAVPGQVAESRPPVPPPLVPEPEIPKTPREGEPSRRPAKAAKPRASVEEAGSAGTSADTLSLNGRNVNGPKLAPPPVSGQALGGSARMQGGAVPRVAAGGTPAPGASGAALGLIQRPARSAPGVAPFVTLGAPAVRHSAPIQPVPASGLEPGPGFGLRRGCRGRSELGAGSCRHSSGGASGDGPCDEQERFSWGASAAAERAGCAVAGGEPAPEARARHAQPALLQRG